MPIEPDAKDWTWVLDRVCPECGFDTQSFPRDELGNMIRANADRWDSFLTHPQARERPSDDVWSALEYGCHIRDVFVLYDERLRLMLEQEDPLYPNWDQNNAAVERRYEEQDPATVLSELKDAAAKLAQRFDALSGPDWTRKGRRSDGANFTIESFGRYFMHDPVHHVDDVEKGFARLAG